MIGTIHGTVLTCEQLKDSMIYKTVIQQEGDANLTMFTLEEFYKGDPLCLDCNIELKAGDKKSYFRIIQIE